jgi:NAD(P)-dependent dehydrogenase (short-subunit alcohol dehydrogenase family)
VDADRPVALVTGANRGIGKAVADGLAAAGLTVIRGARTPDPRDSTQQRLDITDPRSVAQLVGGLERLDALVNNAGVLLDSGTRGVDADLDVARRTLETNLFGSWQLTQACIPLLRASPHPRIVNLSSGMGQLDEMGGGSPGYRISKTALNALTRILSVELAGAGVLVNALCPGWVRTDMGGAGATRTLEEGADTAVWLATLPDNGPTGGFFRNRSPIPW